MKPLFSYPGGKSRMLKHILPLIPDDMACFVEAFGGAAAVLLARERTGLEVFNDIRGEVVNVFRQSKHHGEALARELELFPNSREEFYRIRDNPGSAVTEIQRAARFLHMQRLSFGGDASSFGTGKLGGGASHASMANRIDLARELARRLDKVVVEHLDWQKLVVTYDGPGTFFYFDPPYLDAPCHQYDGWTVDQFREMAAVLAGLKARWLLSTNDRSEIREIFAGHELLAFERQNGIENRPGKSQSPRYQELLIRPAGQGPAHNR